MFDWLYSALGTLMYWFSSIMGGSYALALVLYALVFKIVFLYFSIKQQKTQIKMANLTPKIELIKAKYRGRNDRVTMQRMQQEIMELQQREGGGMFGGCLPLLIQFPIIIFLYNVIRNPLSYICGMTQGGFDKLFSRIENFYLTTGSGLVTAGKSAAEMAASLGTDQITIASFIKEHGIEFADLTNGRAIPNMSLFGIDLGQTPSAAFDGAVSWVIVFIPIFAAALQWLTMFLSKRWNGNTNQLVAADGQTNASMKMMDLMFPAMTLWIAFSFSALMGLYWIFQSALAILQTYILSKVMPLPKFTEEQIKQMRREQKAVERAQRAALKNHKYRSLHYIDEDDYEDLPEVADNNKKPSSSPMLGTQDIPNIKD